MRKLLIAALCALALTIPAKAGIDGAPCPTCWELLWSVQGSVVGPFTIGLRSGSGSIISQQTYPPGTGCYDHWNYSLPGGDASGDHCSIDLPRRRYQMVYQLGNSGPWYSFDTFTLEDVGHNCYDNGLCSAPPPQTCSAVYQPGIFSHTCNQ